jgi:hypothetical protein
MLTYALYRDMEYLLGLFSRFDKRLTYGEVYLQYRDINRQTNMFKTETELLCRYAWKYQFLTLNEFIQYY